MLIDSNKVISVTKLQRELTQQLRNVVSDGEALYVTKNSNIETVVIPMAEYERLKKIDEYIEHMEIWYMVQERMKNYDPSKTILWDDLKDEL
ncbi:MAG: type II toxin-antitoxin system Phd/YefM family antitoxin [Clostridiales bacterium]|nr:type II toxin-antitoxin system Phd/YefM family antitoxin [Clostridiales bacterium]